jgi:hypothetical protein
MGWEQQGRQEHGWFGDGRFDALADPDDPAERDKLVSRAVIVTVYAYQHIRGTED